MQFDPGTEYLATLIAFIISFFVAIVAVPPLIRKMREGKMVGTDVNKPGRPDVPELGGIAVVFAFSISISLMVGVIKLIGDVYEPPFLAAISVFFVASMIGLIDDISRISQKVKAAALIFASLPLMLVHFGSEHILFPFSVAIDVPYYVYWLVLVPIGITGAGNAINMSAGYNGLESGQIVVISSFLLLITALGNPSSYALPIFASLIGCSLALFFYNKYPARVFVGDIGTLGMGAAVAAGVIIGDVEFFGLICLLPAFYESIATAYYVVVGNHNRREACQNPSMDSRGRLSPPEGSERYTLAYLLLSIKPMTEKKLVAAILGLYAISGVIALVLSVI
jgi:UDP-N-acetylglucosamine--dolichyl-phosphate N-acetylglucosaminephosphotransferase